MSQTKQKPILISGAGISSLLLGQALHRANIPFKIFERDQSISFRAQGYRLRLSTEGLDAIENALGPEKFETFWEVCGKTGGAGVGNLNALTAELNKDDFPSQQQQQQPDKPKGPVEQLTSRGGVTVGIARGEMRKVFMEGCEEFITWGHTVIGYEETENGVKLKFQDGTSSEEGEMIVGGEGIYSKVAQQVSNGKLKVYDTGARGIHGQALTPAFKGLGEGVWRIVDESNPKGNVWIITNVRSKDMDDPNIQFGWTMGAAPGVINPPNNDFSIIGKAAADLAKDLTKNWNPKFKPLFEQMNEKDAAFWKITCSTPSGVPEWKNHPRVTVIGDAVHSMTPAGGIGANTAVRDSELLGRLLTEAKGYKEGITLEYEKQMRVYGSEAVDKSYTLGKLGFGIDIKEDITPTI